MRPELESQKARPSHPAPRPTLSTLPPQEAPPLQPEAARAAVLEVARGLRLGYEEEALSGLVALRAALPPWLAVALDDELRSAEECLGRGDLIGLADLLEFYVAAKCVPQP